MKIRNGFTLVELMIVVAIIGILAAIAIPQFANLLVKSQEATTKGNIGTLRSAISIYYGNTDGEYPYDDLSSLILSEKYLQVIPYAQLPPTINSPGHGKLNGVRTGQLPGAISDAVGQINGWVYDNSGPTNDTWGMIVVNCTHEDINGNPWTSF